VGVVVKSSHRDECILRVVVGGERCGRMGIGSTCERKADEGGVPWNEGRGLDRWSIARGGREWGGGRERRVSLVIGGGGDKVDVGDGEGFL